MILSIYKTSSRHNALTKQLTKIAEAKITALEELDVINPVITLTNIDLTGCNYCYIDAFNSYYFIESQIKVRTNVTQLRLSIDVLTTYRDDILKLSGHVTKAENPNPYYSGYNTTFDVRTQVKTLKFKDAFSDNGSFIMVVG